MIKPEFWEDDRICSLPFQTRLFYIALWNFADDEGYIEQREAWLKAKCFPYDDADIRRMIDELSNIGRLETSNEILKITNFLKHQRIDRPKPSDLKDRFEDVSTNDRRMIDESSTTKKKRNEVNIKENKDDFEVFYKAYPLKKGRGQAEKAFLKVNVPVSTLLEAIEKQKKEKIAKKERKEFCPEWKHPATWLNGKCWEDEVTESKPQGVYSNLQTI